jgi:thiosulfate/3-mercaptopyruvate sulfurtransferase
MTGPTNEEDLMTTAFPAFVSVDWLLEHIGDPGLRIVDATTIREAAPDGAVLLRGREAYDRGHIPDAVFAELFHGFNDAEPFIFTVPSQAKFAQAAGALGIGSDTTVVVYEQNPAAEPAHRADIWAARLWWQLRYEGFDRVAVLEGGLKAWTDAGQPLSSAPGQYPPALFEGVRRPALIATREEVASTRGSADTVLIDALPPHIFAGQSPASSPPGHIPGAVNVYFGDLADKDSGHLLPRARLDAIFDPIGALDPARRVITYCGNGPAAAWDALILHHAGRPDVAVYDGSLRDWKSDSNAPLEI